MCWYIYVYIINYYYCPDHDHHIHKYTCVQLLLQQSLWSPTITRSPLPRCKLVKEIGSVVVVVYSLYIRVMTTWFMRSPTLYISLSFFWYIVYLVTCTLYMIHLFNILIFYRYMYMLLNTLSLSLDRSLLCECVWVCTCVPWFVFSLIIIINII